MKLLDFLKSEGINYTISTHEPTYTAQQMAQAEHTPGSQVAKPVLVKVDGRYCLCVLAACCRIDFELLKHQTRAEQVLLANEAEMERIFIDCDIGAEPPIGKLYGMETIMDAQLAEDEQIKFQAGTHEQAVEISTDDFIKLTTPAVFEFAGHI